MDAEAMPKDENVLGAITRGTIDGLHLALNIAAMLISFLALIALVNGIFGGIHNHLFHWFPSSLEQIFGVIFAPIAWVIGIPWRDCGLVGNLLGTRMVINELVAYSMLGAQTSRARSPLICDRNLRAMRFRQFQFYRHSDRRHQRAGSKQTRRTGQAGIPRHDCRHDGEPDVGIDRRHIAAIKRPGQLRVRTFSGTNCRASQCMAGVVSCHLSAIDDPLSRHHHCGNTERRRFGMLNG